MSNRLEEIKKKLDDDDRKAIKFMMARLLKGDANGREQRICMKFIMRELCRVSALPDPTLSAAEKDFNAGSQAVGMMIFEIAGIPHWSTTEDSDDRPSDNAASGDDPTSNTTSG